MRNNVKCKITLPGNRRYVELNMNAYAALGILLAMLLVLVGAVINFFSFSRTAYLEAENLVLSKRNEYLKIHYAVLKEKIVKYDSGFTKLEELCDNVLMLNALPPVFTNVKGLNVGGFSLDDAEAIKKAKEEEITGDMDVLFSQIELKMNTLNTNFTKVYEVMDQNVKKWERVPTIWPTEGWVSSGFGWRESPFNGAQEYHTGLDISNLPDTPIVATANGFISFAGTRSVYGIIVIIEHGYGYETRYGHLAKIHPSIKTGINVKKGQVIGFMGSTGKSTGVHLHYEVVRNGQPDNPAKYLLPEENSMMRRFTYLNE